MQLDRHLPSQQHASVAAVLLVFFALVAGSAAALAALVPLP